MTTSTNSTEQQSTNLPKGSWRRKLLTWLGLTDAPVVRVYRGFARAERALVQGHVFRLSPLPRTRYSHNVVTNTLALLRLFLVRPLAGATVQLRGTDLTTQTDPDGFFRFDYTPAPALGIGWHDVHVDLIGPSQQTLLASGTGQVHVPHPTRYGFISDIDDTFLISHSSTLLKRLQVLLTRNARSRKPFDGVVQHYQLLAEAHTHNQAPNAFFYVSSSEWNLYEYILEFSRTQGLPTGVYLLSQLKRLSQLWKTGQNKHRTKFDRIVRIIETYPEQQFVLLGDDTQEDPDIYRSVVKHFPGQIVYVYLRQVNASNRAKTQRIAADIEAAGVPCCYFAHSQHAMEHSLECGLAQPEDLTRMVNKK